MSRINMKVGITAEQVNEAFDAKTKYMELVNAKHTDLDVSSLNVAIGDMNNAAQILANVLGDDHMATRRVSDASILAREAIKKIDGKVDKTGNQMVRALAKLRMYDGWFVVVGDEKIPVTEAVVVNGQVMHNGEKHPFIPAYMPNVGIPSLFDQD